MARKKPQAVPPAEAAPKARKPEEPQAAPEAVVAAEPKVAVPHGFPVVGIGASAGGIGALEAFFHALPDEPTGVAFVVIQHLAPDHKSLLADLIRRFTRVEIREAEDGMVVRPDCAYIIPPDRDMAFRKGALQLFEPGAPRGMRMPIDFFFRSLAEDQGERAICIVLSGTGSDGTIGVRAIKGEGGMAMAQSPESTEFDSMPLSAISTGLVDFVLGPSEMPGPLLDYVKHAFQGKIQPEAAPNFASILKNIFLVLQSQTSHDFSNYKENTIVRRVERRMAIHKIEKPEDYLKFLVSNTMEVESLFRDLLIGVTSFFRDPAAFQTIKEEVVPALFAGKPMGSPIRIWVCGCSTGEEAYTLALLIRAFIDDEHLNYKVQIFATDIDQTAIEIARKGVFPGSVSRDIPEPYLKRYFMPDPEGGLLRISKTLRDMLVFSEQDAIKDPPLSKLSLISCRNLLIYLNSELQRRLIVLFHYALLKDGFLFLGPSETVGEMTALFTPVSRKHKIYRRRESLNRAATLPLLDRFAVHPRPLTHMAGRHGEGPGEIRRLDYRALTEAALLDHYAQAAVLVNERGEVVHIFGRSGRFLEPPQGDPTNSLLAMAREGLKRGLASTLHRSISQREMAATHGLKVQTNGHFILVNLTVRPVFPEQSGANAADLYLVILEEAQPTSPETKVEGPAETNADSEARIATLEQELRAKEEYIQTALEEMGTSNEELKSANEELQSVNEELGSTNEELETSKEELQSVNEELATVNAELQNKVSELSLAYHDMNSLLSGTGVGILVLDTRLRISRFTPTITQVVSLLPGDVGRPIQHFATNMSSYENLVEDVEAVLESLIPREMEVQTRSGDWFLMRIRPYRTQDNAIEGVVITYLDITGRKRMEDALRENQAHRIALEEAGIRFYLVDWERNNVCFSPEMRSILGLSRESDMTLEQFETFYHPEDAQAVQEAMGRLKDPGEGGQVNLQVRFKARDGQVRRLALTGRSARNDMTGNRIPSRATVVCIEVN